MKYYIDPDQMYAYLVTERDAALELRNRCTKETGNWWFWDGHFNMCKHMLNRLDDDFIRVPIEPTPPALAPGESKAVPA